MEKVQLEVLGLSQNPASQGTYALVLKEMEGERRLPIVIGTPEAMAISNELEGTPRPRPMTHDLLKNAIEALDASVMSVFIHDLSDQTFYAIIQLDRNDAELDSRPSDAIAIALRFNAPIYIADHLLDEAGFTPEELEAGIEEAKTKEKDESTTEKNRIRTRREILEEYLQRAIDQEEYEKAAQIRDEIERLDEE